MIIIDWQQVLEFGVMSPPTFFFFKIILFISVFSFSFKLYNKLVDNYKKSCWAFIKSMDQFRENWYLNAASSNPWTQHISLTTLIPFVSVL